MVHKKILTCSIFILIFTFACASASKGKIKKVSNSNANIYNSIDTTKEAETPGADTTTLRILSDNSVAYQEAKESDNKFNYDDELSIAFFGPSYEFDDSVYDDPVLIRDVQQELNSRGYTVGKADGILGVKTYYSLINFQKDNGLMTTGEINQATLDALEMKLIPIREIDDDQIYAE